MRIDHWVKCRLGLHQRDARRVAKRGAFYQAPCKYCGRQMQKLVAGGSWQRM